MKAVRCANCGFVGFGNEGFCKKCGWSLELHDQSSVTRAEQQDNARRRRRIKVKIVFGALALAVAGAGCIYGYRKVVSYFDRNPLYLAAISNSKEFQEAITVRVNRKELTLRPSPLEMKTLTRKPGWAVKAAEVLTAAGYLTMTIDKQKFVEKDQAALITAKAIGEPPPDVVHEVESDRLVIDLTEKGQREAATWKETEEAYGTGSVQFGQQYSEMIPSWRIPIGEHELARLVSVESLPWDANFETVRIKFRWRWRPNSIGENFPRERRVSGVAGKSARGRRGSGLKKSN
jgi:hypothetical protein